MCQSGMRSGVKRLIGALVGWKRAPSSNGIVLTLQVAEAASDFRDKDFAHVNLALNERQLRSLARDLTRAAEDRGIDIFPKKRGLFRWPA
jgi:hypothetical protein